MGWPKLGLGCKKGTCPVPFDLRYCATIGDRAQEGIAYLAQVFAVRHKVLG